RRGHHGRRDQEDGERRWGALSDGGALENKRVLYCSVNDILILHTRRSGHPFSMMRLGCRYLSSPRSPHAALLPLLVLLVAATAPAACGGEPGSDATGS